MLGENWTGDRGGWTSSGYRRDGSLLCSGDMLLEALVACAGVALQAVATSLGISVTSGRVRAEGDLDFRGTLGVDREAPVGFSAIRPQPRSRHRN